MFVFYAVAAGLLLGSLRGGRPSRLLGVSVAWPWLAIGGLLVQVALFSTPITPVVGDAGASIYVASNSAVLVFILRNLRTAGVAVIALGAAANLVAIVANGGYMPVSSAAMGELGRVPPVGYSNVRLTSQPALEPLTDIIPLPGFIPFANVISLGDVLICVGLTLTVERLMGRQPADPTRPGQEQPEPPPPVTARTPSNDSSARYQRAIEPLSRDT